MIRPSRTITVSNLTQGATSFEVVRRDVMSGLRTVPDIEPDLAGWMRGDADSHVGFAKLLQRTEEPLYSNAVVFFLFLFDGSKPGRWAGRVLRRAVDLEDVLVTGLLDFLGSISRYDPACGDLFRLFAQILKNQSIDAYRAQARYEEHLSRWAADEAANLVQGHEGGSSLDEKRQAIDSIPAVLGELIEEWVTTEPRLTPSDRRLLFELRDLGWCGCRLDPGMPGVVAKRVRTTPCSVSTRLCRLNVMLHDYLRHHPRFVQLQELLE